MNLITKVKENKAKLAVACSMVGVGLLPAVNCFAGQSDSDVTSSLTSAFSTVKSDALDAIGKIVPIALPILGAFLVVTIGIKIFKKVSSKA